MYFVKRFFIRNKTKYVFKIKQIRISNNFLVKIQAKRIYWVEKVQIQMYD
jgi:hypothetical protein